VKKIEAREQPLEIVVLFHGGQQRGRDGSGRRARQALPANPDLGAAPRGAEERQAENAPTLEHPVREQAAFPVVGGLREFRPDRANLLLAQPQLEFLPSPRWIPSVRSAFEVATDMCSLPVH